MKSLTSRFLNTLISLLIGGHLFASPINNEIKFPSECNIILNVSQSVETFQDKCIPSFSAKQIPELGESLLEVKEKESEDDDHLIHLNIHAHNHIKAIWACFTPSFDSQISLAISSCLYLLFQDFRI